jgi:FKBP-type peptidyl-prolyl cis-trans isomerase
MKLLLSICCILLSAILLVSCSVEPEGSLEITDIVVGKGAEAVAGKTVTVHYVGTLTNGTKFDSSRDRGTPFSFVLGAGKVIQGWEQGIPTMKVGGKRKLVIPPSLGYGNRAVSDKIPANSTLVFEVELLNVQ